MASTPKGVCRVKLLAEPRWAYAAYPDQPVAHVFPHAFPGGKAVVAYLNGFKNALNNVPLDPTGTPFQMAVWQAAQKIPFGETRSYGDIARAIGNPKAVRAVGQALGANPIPLLVPCHRVLAGDGSLGGWSGGGDLKTTLLAYEANPEAGITATDAAEANA